MALLIRQSSLNDRDKKFLRAVVEGATIPAATELAGYDNDDKGYQVLTSPRMLALLHAEVQRRLAIDAPVSIRVLRKIRDDDTAPARVRADVALHLAKMAGHVVPASSSGTPEKQIHEMTRDEMVAYIERNQAAIDQAVERLSDMAAPLNAQHNAPKPGGAAPKPLDYLD